MSVHVRVRVGHETYAMPVEHVLEVAALGDLAPVPGSGGAVLGVCNLRGQVLPVFDLATIFGIGRDEAPARLVVAEESGRRAGFAIDEVTDVGELPELAEASESRFLLGSALVDDALVGVVDVPRLFRALAVDEEDEEA